MWSDLEKDKKLKYKTYITNFASLSEAFSQKNELSELEEATIPIITPIINSKFQETVFQKSFGAIGEDISNTSYDASLILGSNRKYLVGIKSFGFHSGDQKIAQFKSSSTSENWEETLSLIKRNADELPTKQEADKKNLFLYLKLAKRIAILRNNRIASSKELVKGFKATDKMVQSVYHVLMPSRLDNIPRIFVGETGYNPIEIGQIAIIGSTNKRTPTNFKFTDGKHQYKYTSADSQLYMSFNNRDIVVDEWRVTYVEDPFYLFENLHLRISKEIEDDKKNAIVSTVSWMIANIDGEVEQSSGYNGFDGASKLGRANNYREKRIAKIKEKYQNLLQEQELDNIILLLEKILLNKWKTASDKVKMKKIRAFLIRKVENIKNEKLLEDIEALVYRPTSEMYIPIPNSRHFHNENPHFFGSKIGMFKEGTSKLLLPKEKRRFKLEFLTSGDVIEAYVNQDDGKGIQSYSNQQILGEWILRGVFQLEPREILTGKRLEEIGINAVRLTKFSDSKRGIGLEFIWINPDDPPDDAIGWVST